jgi:hypothetical protein
MVDIIQRESARNSITRNLTRTKKLAAAILRDRERRNQKPAAFVRRRDDDFDPFAFTHWRVVAGGDPGYLPRTAMRRGPTGWFIACWCCAREFESRGWAYCSSCMDLTAEARRPARDSGGYRTPCARLGHE